MAERLLVQFERQSEHRMTLETKVVNGDIRRSNWGLVGGFVFAMGVLALAAYSIANNYPAAAVAAIIADFLSFGTIFIYGSEARRRERDRKLNG